RRCRVARRDPRVAGCSAAHATCSLRLRQLGLRPLCRAQFSHSCICAKVRSTSQPTGYPLRVATTGTLTREEHVVVSAPRQRSRVIADARGVYIIWFRDVLRWWRDRQRILPSIVQPILYLFVFGVGLGSAIGGGIG